MTTTQRPKDVPTVSHSSTDDVRSADLGESLIPEPLHKSESFERSIMTSTKSTTFTPNADAGDKGDTQTSDEKILAARSLLSPKHCLFCPIVSPSFSENLTHMSTTHSFFVPDDDYLMDLDGLIAYLGEKIVIGNICLYCNSRSREFRSVDAVRKHMVDKSHCKIAYDSQSDRLELSEFYDFSSSYPDQDLEKCRSKKRNTPGLPDGEGVGHWEDLEDDVKDGDEGENGGNTNDRGDSLPEDELTYGKTPYELLLPSGARIGHRSMMRYYQQSFPRSALVLTRNDSAETASQTALVRRLLADKNSAMVPRGGGYGAYGVGAEAVKARSPGEAREAGRHVREFRDQKRREDFKSRIAFSANYPIHFFEPFCMVSASLCFVLKFLLILT